MMGEFVCLQTGGRISQPATQWLCLTADYPRNCWLYICPCFPLKGLQLGGIQRPTVHATPHRKISESTLTEQSHASTHCGEMHLPYLFLPNQSSLLLLLRKVWCNCEGHPYALGAGAELCPGKTVITHYHCSWEILRDSLTLTYFCHISHDSHRFVVTDLLIALVDWRHILLKLRFEASVCYGKVGLTFEAEEAVKHKKSGNKVRHPGA